MKRSTRVIGWLWLLLTVWGLGTWLVFAIRRGSPLPVPLDQFLSLAIALGILKKQGWAWCLAVLTMAIAVFTVVWALWDGDPQAWRDSIHTYREITSLWGKWLLAGSLSAVLVLLAIDPPWRWRTEEQIAPVPEPRTEG